MVRLIRPRKNWKLLSKVDFEKLSFDSEHINDERQHEVTFDEAKDFIRRASFSETVWKGQFERYYSEDGAAYVRTSDAFIRTAFKREDSETWKMIDL